MTSTEFTGLVRHKKKRIQPKETRKLEETVDTELEIVDTRRI